MLLFQYVSFFCIVVINNGYNTPVGVQSMMISVVSNINIDFKTLSFY